MQNPSQRRLDVWKRQQHEASLRSDPSQPYYQQAAKAICGCYRRDEAQDPEAFANALTAVLSEYDSQVVDYVADPRTGVITEFPMGLPNVGQIKELCDKVRHKMHEAAKPITRAIAKPYVPPPLKPGQITYGQFTKLAAEGKTNTRPVGAFEPGGYLGPIT
jgi:hypothetical protein